MKLEQVKAENQSLLERRFNNASTIILALVGTSAVCLTIVLHWRTYDWINKLLAVGFLLNLASTPLTVIIKGWKATTAKPDRWIQTAYIWVILATVLFNRRM